MHADTKRFACPKGCGRDDFKSNSAAYAHAKHCTFEPETNPGDGLSPSETLILDRVAAVAVTQIEQGMAGLQERVQENIVNSLIQIVPQMVAKETESMAGKIAEELKENPNANFLKLLDQTNAFLTTPLGKIVEKYLIGRTGGSQVSMRGLSRGMSTAQHLLLSKKTDIGSMAEVILGAAEIELQDRKLDTETRDFMIGMKNTAKLALSSKAREEAGAPKAGEEE